MSATPSLLQPGSFAGKTAFVTGGGTGLGLAVSTRLGHLGANIVCASRSLEHHASLLGWNPKFMCAAAGADVRMRIG